MKVVVVGGAGVFGARLVELLRRDDHEVWAAGRRAAPLEAVAQAHGAQVLVLDARGDLMPLWAINPEVVVDAAGPFHAYGDDPYRLPRACIAKRMSYFDLADDAAFCAGISVLDADARAAGVFARSGMSSVPAVSSAAVTALAAGDPIDLIDSAILPGNRAPRGRAVVASILAQAGLSFSGRLDGGEVAWRGWAAPANYMLADGMERRGWMIAVPDQQLFGAHFGARTVIFRAGLELTVMNQTLAVFSWLRGRLRFPVPGWFVGLTLFLARLLSPFGTDQGGMVVTVVTGHEQRTWRLIARAGEGPFVPAVAVRAALRAPDQLQAGAGPGVGVATLAAIESAMSDLAVTTEKTTASAPALFSDVLGEACRALPPAVAALHDVPAPRRWAGRARVTRGSGLMARIIASVVRFPQAAEDVAVEVTMMPSEGQEVWVRRFGDRSFRSVLRRSHDGMTESFGPMTFALDLQVSEGALHFPVRRGWFLGLPLPRFALPRSVAREYEVAGAFAFDVGLYAPLGGGLIVRYQGTLSRDVEIGIGAPKADGAVRED